MEGVHFPVTSLQPWLDPVRPKEKGVPSLFTYMCDDFVGGLGLCWLWSCTWSLLSSFLCFWCWKFHSIVNGTYYMMGSLMMINRISALVLWFMCWLHSYLFPKMFLPFSSCIEFFFMSESCMATYKRKTWYSKFCVADVCMPIMCIAIWYPSHVWSHVGGVASITWKLDNCSICRKREDGRGRIEEARRQKILQGWSVVH